MNCMFDFLWYDLLYKPLYNLLIFFYTISPGLDMGLGIIFLTIFIRLLLLPLSIRGARAEYRLERIHPLIEQTKRRYKHNIEKQKIKIRELLRGNRIGIFSNLFALGFQILFFVVLYRIFSSGLQLGGHNVLYAFNLVPEEIDPAFFGRFNLVHTHMRASLFAAGVVFLQQAIRRVRHIDEASTVEKVLLFGLPIGTYIAVIYLPSSKAVFIATSVIFTLWLRFIKWIIVRFFLRDDEVKKNLNQLWTS